MAVDNRIYDVPDPSVEVDRKLLDAIEETGADLVVMGTVARTGVPGFFIGNTAERIVSRLRCSALTVKPGEFHTPIV